VYDNIIINIHISQPVAVNIAF